jgi:uncharacterized protein YndB with AHSA1/START domain
MPQHDEPSIERHADLDIDVNDLWTLISTADGWSSWLVDVADVTISPGQTGTATDDGVERSVQIDDVDPGHRIGFSWWNRDDPASVSYVQLDIVGLPDNRSRLHVTEQFRRATSTTATTTTATTCSIGWDVRLVSLWLMALPFHVKA